MAEQWTAVLARMGTPTGDGRILTPGGITNRDLPLPLMWQRRTEDGHGGSVIIGRIEEMSFTDDRVIASGTLLDVPEAAEAKTLIESGVIGPSVDLDDLNYVMDADERVIVTDARIAGATLVPIPAFAEVSIAMAAEGTMALTASVRTSGWSGMPIADAARSWDSGAAKKNIDAWAGDDISGKYARAFLYKSADGDPNNKTTYGFPIADVIDGTLTIVPRAVFAAAAALQGSRGGTSVPASDQSSMKTVLSSIYKRLDRPAPFSLVAAAAPLPPLEFFQNPHLDGPTPLTVGEDGRVFGHIATWGTCHVGLPGCVTPPSSPSDYAYFLTGAEKTKDGVTVPVGKLTIGGGHAAPNDGFVAAAEHYDNVGTAVAAVFAGEDEHGIWVSGYIVPGVAHDSVASLQRSPISGDWRRIGGNLELIAAHAVNVPGFPVPRAKVRFANDAQQSLVGQFAPLREQLKPVQPKSVGPSPADLAKLAQRKQADAARAKLTWALKRGR